MKSEPQVKELTPVNYFLEAFYYENKKVCNIVYLKVPAITTIFNGDGTDGEF